MIDGIQATSIDRTLLDLSAVLELESLEDALDSALRKRLTSVARLKLRVSQQAGKRGMKNLRKLLDERSSDGQPTESRFETRLNRLLQDGGLPPLRQFTVWDGGEFVARVDFCYPEAKVIVEADSYRWHSGKRAWQRDLERRNQLTALGWQIVHITWDDLIRRPRATLSRVRALMQPQLFRSSG
jgi:very-short-patch-repair endonuclease